MDNTEQQWTFLEGKSKWTNHFEGKRGCNDKDPNVMDIDRMATEKRTILMKKGACFICEEPGHMAKEHFELEKKKKKTTNIRRTEASSSFLTSKKKNVKEIHALIESLSPEEMKELLALLSASQEKEDDSYL